MWFLSWAGERPCSECDRRAEKEPVFMLMRAPSRVRTRDRPLQLRNLKIAAQKGGTTKTGRRSNSLRGGVELGGAWDSGRLQQVVTAGHGDTTSACHFQYAVRAQDFQQAVDFVCGAGDLHNQR